MRLLKRLTFVLFTAGILGSVSNRAIADCWAIDGGWECETPVGSGGCMGFYGLNGGSKQLCNNSGVSYDVVVNADGSGYYSDNDEFNSGGENWDGWDRNGNYLSPDDYACGYQGCAMGKG